MEKVKLLILNNFTFFHNVFYAICILRFFNSHISVFVCSFFEFGMVSKWCRSIRELLNPFPQNDALKIYSCRKHCEKGEIACYKQFLLFSQCFLPYMTLIFHFQCTLKCRLQFLSILTSQIFFRLVMG